MLRVMSASQSSQLVKRLGAAALAFGASACASGAHFTSTWKAPDAQPVTLNGQKVLAVFITNRESSRRAAEAALADQITRHGAQGVPAYTVLTNEKAKDTEGAKAKLTADGFSGVVTMRVVDQRTETNYTPGYSSPVYGNPWGYWGYGWGTVYSPGYMTTSQKVSIETLVYSLKQNKLMWAGTAEVTDPDKIDDAVRDLTDDVANEMTDQGLLKKAG